MRKLLIIILCFITLKSLKAQCDTSLLDYQINMIEYTNEFVDMINNDQFQSVDISENFSLDSVVDEIIGCDSSTVLIFNTALGNLNKNSAVLNAMKMVFQIDPNFTAFITGYLPEEKQVYSFNVVGRMLLDLSTKYCHEIANVHHDVGYILKLAFTNLCAKTGFIDKGNLVIIIYLKRHG